MIPKVVHRCWFGPHPMRQELIEFGHSWERHGYETVLHTEQTLDLESLETWPILREIRDGPPVIVGGGVPELGVWVQWADVVSYELIWRYGGIYANTDIELLRPLDDLLGESTAFAGLENDTFICNALFGATPEHPFFRELLDDLPARFAAGRAVGQAMNEITGPYCITAAQARTGRLEVFPPQTFYPFGYLEMDREWDDHPAAYTRHHWGHTRGRWSHERECDRPVAS